MSEIVESGRPFVWLPNQLPYFFQGAKSLQVRCKGVKLVADRSEDGVPVFEEIIQVCPNSFALPVAPAAQVPELPPQVAPDGPDPGGEAEGLEACEGREDELLRESMTTRHKMCHMSKNPFCETCRSPNV